MDDDRGNRGMESIDGSTFSRTLVGFLRFNDPYVRRNRGWGSFLSTIFRNLFEVSRILEICRNCFEVCRFSRNVGRVEESFDFNPAQTNSVIDDLKFLPSKFALLLEKVSNVRLNETLHNAADMEICSTARKIFAYTFIYNEAFFK